jgi:PAS domain S-box-containing protein
VARGSSSGKSKAPLNGITKRKNPLSPYRFHIIMALVAAVILVGGYLFYYFQEEQMSQRIEGGLSIMAQLEANQIVDWRTERLNDAVILVGSPFFAEGVESYLASPADTEAKNKIIARLAIIEKTYPYQDILLTDTKGKVLLSLNNSVNSLSDVTLAQLAIAINEHKAVMTDFYSAPNSNSPQLDIIAPIFPWGQELPQTLGAVVFYVDPSQYLYPLLESSPMASQTGETLLVERDGDHVLYLNELHYQKDAALKLTIPLSQQNVAAVMAVLGKEGVVEGKDYRGVEVLAALKHIPDSPWYIVSKIDTSEALAPWRARSGFIIATLAGLLAAALSVIGLIWQRRQRLAYEALYQAELKTQALRSHFEYLVKYANDIILLIDENLHIAEANDRALETYGYAREEMLGLPIDKLIPPEDMAAFQERMRKIKIEGEMVAEAIHQRKDGSTFPVEISGRVVKIGDKTYLQGIIRDITERKRMEQTLQDSEEKYRSLVQQSPVGIGLSQQNRVIFANPALLEIFGYDDFEEFAKAPIMDRVAPESRELIANRMRKVAQGETQETDFEYNIIRKDGAVRTLHARSSWIKLGSETYTQTVFQDITEQKKTEEALRESEEEFRSVFNNSADAMLLTIPDGRIIAANPASSRMFGYTEEEFRQYGRNVILDVNDPRLKTALEQRKRTGIFKGELDFKRKDGTRFPGEMSSVVFKDKDGQDRTSMVIHDLTKRKQAEETLKESEEKFRSLVESTSDWIWEINRNGVYTYASPKVKELLGYEPEEVIGKTPFDFMPDEEAKRIANTFNDIVASMKPMERLENTCRHKNGNLVTLETSGVPVFDIKGILRGYRGVDRDITERKRAEEATKTEKAKLQALVDGLAGTQIGIDIVGKDYKVRFQNQILEERFGDLTGKLCYVNYMGLDKACDPCPMKEAIKTNRPQSIEVTGADGRYYNLFSAPLPNPDGTVDQAIEVVVDITEHKQAEEALRQSEERYRTILERMDESYYEVDLAGNFTFVNDATCRRLGHSREELIGMNYRAYTPKERADNTFKTFNMVYQTGQPIIGYPALAIAKDGSLIFAERSIFPIQNEEGKIIGFRGISRDVTERKRAEEERRQLEIKAQITGRLASVGEMAAGVAHEINNPLTAVTGYAQLLVNRDDVPPEVRNDLAAINDGAQRVAGIVQRLLAFSRQTKPLRKLVDINELIESTLILRAYQLRVNNIEVVTRLAPDLLETVVDPGQIQQVFLNLVVNAETEMKLAHGKGKMTITTEKDNNIIKIRVKDNGPGIRPEVMDKIFDPFFTTREVGQGTGLGLSLCYGIVTEHNGRIYAESQPGKGATFFVELPVIAETKPPKPTEPDIKKSKKMSKARILVVDDEEVVRDLVNRVLTAEGHKVETVDNASAALKKIEGRRYNLALIDIKMPGMNGVELYRRIQKIDKSLARKVVFITGDIMGADTEKFLAETKSAHIEKPFDAQKLTKEIRRALS